MFSAFVVLLAGAFMATFLEEEAAMGEETDLKEARRANILEGLNWRRVSAKDEIRSPLTKSGGFNHMKPVFK